MWEYLSQKFSSRFQRRSTAEQQQATPTATQREAQSSPTSEQQSQLDISYYYEIQKMEQLAKSGGMFWSIGLTIRNPMPCPAFEVVQWGLWGNIGSSS